MSDFSKFSPDHHPVIPPGASAPLDHKTTLERIYERDRQPSGWQPIETAPKDGRNILIGIEGDDSMCTAHWSLLSEDWFSFLTGTRVVPTHWMPLPAPPAAPAAPAAPTHREYVGSKS